MMLPWFDIALLALTAICVAVMDTLHHHHSSSVFRDADRLGFWGPANHVWRRRYLNPANPIELKWQFRVPLLAQLIESVYDGWHLAKTVALASVIVVIAETPTQALVMWGGYFVTFELVYRFILRRR